jgi:hypothetical protein
MPMLFDFTTKSSLELSAMPSLSLPAMTLPAPDAVPPMVLPPATNAMMPMPEFGSAALPVASVPIQLPTISFDAAPAPWMLMPVALPEMRLPVSVVKPPIRLLLDVTSTPVAPALAPLVPATSVPM